MKPNAITRFIMLMTIWLWGGFVYYVAELVWRSHSHPSMFVVGGICIIILGHINNLFPWEMPMLYQSLIGAVAITAVEFLSGCIVNLWLGLGVWDYSNLPFNILGQVCLPFFFLWIPMAAFGIYLHDFLRWKLYNEEKPRYRFL